MPAAAAAALPGLKLLRHDRRLGHRFVAGADEAGRGALAGPLVCAAVLFDHDLVRGHVACPLATLNDSKQLSAGERESLYPAIVAAATAFAVRIISAAEIDRVGLKGSNLDGLRGCLELLAPEAEICLVDYFRLGPGAPPHQALVHGDTKSAAIAAASVVAKVTRDRLMQRLDAAYPQYGFAAHVGYITKRHVAAVREHGYCPQHRRSFKVKFLP